MCCDVERCVIVIRCCVRECDVERMLDMSHEVLCMLCCVEVL